MHFRATDYLSQPHWAVGLNWNHFPVAPIMELARHMGAQFPPKLQLTGTMDGAIGYTGQGSLQGALGFHDTALAIPDSPPVRFEQAHIILGNGHARLSPTVVRGGENDEARIEGGLRPRCAPRRFTPYHSRRKADVPVAQEWACSKRTGGESGIARAAP